MALTFDANYYLTQRPDVFQAFVATAGSTGLTWAQFAQQHYNNHGRFEGSNPNAVFNTDEYLTANVDVAAAGVNPFEHYLNHGVYEGRAPNASFPSRDAFDWETYVAANPDLGEAGIDTAEEAYVHFVIHGQFENRPGTPAIDTGIPGQTFTLKVGEDSLTGTKNNDTFNAPGVQDNVGGIVDTLESIDILDGGEGDDVLNVTVINGGAPILKNIETVNARFAGAGTLDLTNSSGVETLRIANSTKAAQVDGVGAVSNIAVTDQVQDVGLDGSTADTLNIQLSNFGSKAGPNVLDIATGATAAKASTINYTVNNTNAQIAASTASAAATISIAATGENILDLADDAASAKSVTITGKGSVDLSATPFTGNLKTFDASGNEGGVTAEIQSGVAVAVKGGKGDDVIRMDTAVVADSTVALGDGNDALYVGDQLGKFASVDGGAGDADIINITDGATFDDTNSKKVTGFEILDVSGGTGDYDISLGSFAKVQIDEAVSGALTSSIKLENVASGFTLNVASKAGGAGFDVAADTEIVLKTDGKNDVINLSYTINDGDKNGTAAGINAQTVTIADVETINIAASVGKADGDASVKNADHKVTFVDLVIDDAKTLKITGDASVEFTALTNGGNTLTKVDASGSNGDITLDASTLGAAINYTGSAGVDTYDATGLGDTIYTGKGADVVTLGAGNDVFVLQTASDSQVTDTDGDGKVTLAADAGFDVVDGFAAGADKIDLLSFNFSGSQREVVDVSALLTATTDLTSVEDLFSSAGGDRGVAIYDNGTNTYVLVDANKDGNFSAADDIIIQLTGFGIGLSSSDFSF